MLEHGECVCSWTLQTLFINTYKSSSLLYKLLNLCILMITAEEAVTVSKQYERMLFVIRAPAVTRGYFPIHDRIYFSLSLFPLLSSPLLSLSPSLPLSYSFCSFNICPDLRALPHYSYLDICHC